MTGSTTEPATAPAAKTQSPRSPERVGSPGTPPKTSPKTSPKSSPKASPKALLSPKSPPKSPSNASETAPGPSGILPPETWTEVEEDYTDADSTLGDDAASSTASLTASILEYRTFHGRTYHSNQGNALYWGSNDDAAAEAMDINHHMLTLAMGGRLHMAPLEEDKVKKAIDIGTGTGVWAIDFADAFPATTVIGTDVSPIQPTWVPPNLSFEMDDATQPWTFQPNSADYIHLRYLLGSIADWDALYGEAYKALAPGGWVEHYEAAPYLESDDGTVGGKHAMGQWGRIFVEGSKGTGRSFTVVPDGVQEEGMRRAGFGEVGVWEFKCPIGGWPRDPKLREIGLYARMALESDIEGYVLFITNVISGWSREQVLVYIAHLRSELHNDNIHGYFRLRVVWGRKPEKAPST